MAKSEAKKENFKSLFLLVSFIESYHGIFTFIMNSGAMSYGKMNPPLVDYMLATAFLVRNQRHSSNVALCP